jgi:hypothetical protein
LLRYLPIIIVLLLLLQLSQQIKLVGNQAVDTSNVPYMYSYVFKADIFALSRLTCAARSPSSPLHLPRRYCYQHHAIPCTTLATTTGLSPFINFRSGLHIPIYTCGREEEIRDLNLIFCVCEVFFSFLFNSPSQVSFFIYVYVCYKRGQCLAKWGSF